MITVQGDAMDHSVKKFFAVVGTVKGFCDPAEKFYKILLCEFRRFWGCLFQLLLLLL